jgi:hypothetical protein
VADDEVIEILRSVAEYRYGVFASMVNPTVAAKPLADAPIDCDDVSVTVGIVAGRTSIIIGTNPVE